MWTLQSLCCLALLTSCSSPRARTDPAPPPRAEPAREEPSAPGRTLTILRRRKQSESLWPITVNLAVSWRGYRVSATAEQLTPVELAALERFIPLAGGQHDTRKLGEHLYSLKQRFPRARRLILSAEPAIRYATIVSTLDAARERVVIVDGKPRRLELFPDVLFSTTR